MASSIVSVDEINRAAEEFLPFPSTAPAKQRELDDNATKFGLELSRCFYSVLMAHAQNYAEMDRAEEVNFEHVRYAASDILK